MLDTGYSAPAVAAGGSLAPVGNPAVEYVPDLTKLRKQYKEWQDAKAEERKEVREARHYYHGDQWTEDELKVLRKRRQPPITFNRINRKVDGVVGTIMKLRQDPKAFPRTPKHEEGAELATAALRYALDQTRWEEKEGETVRDGGIEGIGIVELVIEEGDQGDKEIGIDLVDGDTWFYDPRSFRDDFSDARYMGVAKWMHLDDVKEMFPDHSDELDGLITSGGGLTGIDQQDRDKVWLNVEKKHLFTVEHWYIEKGEWHQCFYTADVKLGHSESQFVDERGKSMSKYIAFSAAVDHDGDRYGFVRNLKSPQDEMNMRRSKALHQLNTRRFLAEKGVIDNIERFRIESSRPDGVMEVHPGALKNKKIEFEDGTKQAEWQGQMEMLAEAKAEIENFGPTLVEKGMEKSGRAIALLQQAGLAELGPFIKAYRGWKLRVYRAVWNAIQKHWSGERWIRVTDSEGAAQFIQLNGVQLDQMGQPVMVNAVGSLDVDVILDEAPDSVNTMQDVFEMLESLAAAGVPVPPEVVIEMSGLPSSMKKRIGEMLEKAKQAPPPDPVVQEAQRIALDAESSKAMLNKAGAQEKIAHAAERWAGIATKPDQMAQERETTDRDFQERGVDRQHQSAQAGADRQHQAVQAGAERQARGEQADKQLQAKQSAGAA